MTEEQTEKQRFGDILALIQSDAKSILERASNPANHPDAIATLATIGTIINGQKAIALLTAAVTELQAGKIQVSEWVDVEGRFFTKVLDNGAIHTYNGSGEMFVPIEPCRPANSISLETSHPPARVSVPKFHRVKGQQQVRIEEGAISIEVDVRSGEVSSSNGEGTLKSGDRIAWQDRDGMSAIDFCGADPDTEYLIVVQRKHPTPAPNIGQPPVVTERIDYFPPPPEDSLTGELLPSPTN